VPSVVALAAVLLATPPAGRAAHPPAELEALDHDGAIWPGCEAARALAFAARGVAPAPPAPVPCGGTKPVPTQVRNLSEPLYPGTAGPAPRSLTVSICGAHHEQLSRMGAAGAGHRAAPAHSGPAGTSSGGPGEASP
jgi:hypothetical protein